MRKTQILFLICLSFSSALAFGEAEQIIIEQGRTPASMEDCKELAKNLHSLLVDNRITRDDAEAQFIEQGCDKRLQKHPF